MAVFIGGISGVDKVGRIKSIEIWGKKWFQKSYGNTYHAVKVYINDKLIATSPVTYGYGEQYIQTAESLLRKAGYLKRKSEFESLSRYCRERKIKFLAHASDVKTERELKDFSKS